MSAMTDAIITYAIVRKFTTPIKDTNAYKGGWVDANGTPTDKAEHDRSQGARDEFTLLDRLVFKLRRMLTGLPKFAKLLSGYAASLAFIKESKEADDFSVFAHIDFNDYSANFLHGSLLGENVVSFNDHLVISVAENPSMLARLVEAYENGTQDTFVFEDGEAAGNAVSTGQVQGLATEPVITPQMQKKWTTKNAGRKIEEIK